MDAILDNYGMSYDAYIYNNIPYMYTGISTYFMDWKHETEMDPNDNIAGVISPECFDVYSQIDSIIKMSKCMFYVEAVNLSPWFKKHAYRRPYEAYRFTSGIPFIMKMIKRHLDGESMGLIEFYNHEKAYMRMEWMHQWKWWVVIHDSYNHPNIYRLVKYMNYSELKKFNRGFKNPKHYWCIHRQDFMLDDPDEFDPNYADK